MGQFFPVSNFPFWGKVVEEEFELQLQKAQEEVDYINEVGLQSWVYFLDAIDCNCR